MLTISAGHSVKYFTDAVATGRENYYTGAVAAGEPPGRWYGRGAELLGLRGLVDAQDMTALYERFLDPRDPLFKEKSRWTEASTLGHTGRKYLSEDELYERALDAEPDASPERRAELRVEAGKRARQNVAYLDATFSVPKSVTVLHAAFEAQEIKARRAGDREAEMAWAAHREAMEEAIWAGNRAAIDYLMKQAGYSRVGHHGGAVGRWVDAHDWVVASFFQHDSRDHDPQLHIHNAILNRVQGPDGVWRTIDSRAVHKVRPAAAAVGERTTEAHLLRSLRVRSATRPDGKAREIVGIAQAVLDLVSSRRRAITPKTAGLAAAFETKFGREPNALELDRLSRQATFATRRAKSHHGESVEERLERVDRELRAEIAGGLAEVAHHVLDLAEQVPDGHSLGEEWSPAAVIETAMADVQRTKSGWTAPDLTRAINAALPDDIGPLDGEQVAALLDGLTEQALPLAVALDAAKPGEDVLPSWARLANGQSAYDPPGGRLYATPEHVHTERALLAATRGDAPALSVESVQAFLAELGELGIELGVDQAAAVRGMLTSGADIESLVGPAGTGKSFVVGALAKAWQDPALWGGTHHRVVGLAASQIATEVLEGEGLAAQNIARWLATQDRLATGQTGGDDVDWRLRPGDLVVVDESAMADTAALAAIHRHAVQAGAKLLLVGDHRQLAAIGAGGAMDLLAQAGSRYELTEARRFQEEWERHASLRLRAGDGSVLGEYHKHGRLLDAGTVEQAEASAARGWLADTLTGRHALLLVDTNEQAARLSAALRAELVRLGRVVEDGVPLGLQGTYAGVGDLVQARLNGWHLAGVEGNRQVPINRSSYRVLETREDGALEVTPLHHAPDRERIVLPANYVGEYLALGYASTVHAAQGLTVDTTHQVTSPRTGPEALYVGMTRGRFSNTAHVTTLAVPEDAEPGQTQDAVRRNPTAVLAGTLETAEPTRSALATASESIEDAKSVRIAAERLADAAEIATGGRTAAWLDALTANGTLTVTQRTQLAAEDGAATLNRLLRRVELAGHDPHQVLADAITERPLDGARQLTNVLHHRITAAVSLDPVGDTYADWTPRIDDPDDARYLTALADAADERQAELAEQIAAEPPPWAVEALGQPPQERVERAAWADRAGLVAAHRELTGFDDPAEALGPPPKPGQVEAYASWRAAWRALGRPEADRDELEMSDGQLRVRVRAYQRETAWAPRYVTNELAGTTQAAAKHRATAALRAAQAAATTDTQARTRLQREANEATALADTLDERIAQLRQVEQARGEWLAHTAATRAAADRATAELAARHAGDTTPDDTVTAEEWLAAHQAADRAEDPHRQITDEADLADTDVAVDEPHRDHVDAREHSDEHSHTSQQTDDGERDRPADRGEPAAGREDSVDRASDSGAAEPVPAGPETEVPDVRDVAANEPRGPDEDAVRVPSADETAESIRRAQRALAEIEQRKAADQAQEAEEQRAAQLALWHAEDQAAAEREQNRAAEPEPAVSVGGADHD